MAGGTSSVIRDLLEHARTPGMISFAGGLPDPDSFPAGRLAELSSAVLDRGRVLQYGLTRGEPEACLSLATLFGGADPDDLLITAGSQQALDLLVRSLVDPGDAVVCGDPDYLGFLGVVRGARARLHPMPVDEHGLDTEALQVALARGLRPRLCYVVPHFHNPTGATIARERWAQLRALSARYGFIVIEDDPYRELHFRAAPDDVAPDPDLTVRLRTTSKVLAPGLRIGALEAPRGLRRALEIEKQGVDLHTSTVTQAIAAGAVGADWFPGHLDALRSRYRERCQRFVTLLQDGLGGRVEFVEPDGGMFLWARFQGVDTEAWLPRALAAGVTFVPGSAFASNDGEARRHRERARLSFATASPVEMADGVARLAATIEG